MNENLIQNKDQFLTIKQFAEKNPWPSETALRNLYYNRKENGLDKAFIKLGRRIIVDEETLFKLIRGKVLNDKT